MTIPAIGPALSAAVGFVPTTPPTLDPEPAKAAGAAGADFGQLLGNGLERLQALQSNADELAVQAATGNLQNLHDYTIAATEAHVATQLTAAVRNKALESFNEIMRMAI